MEKSINPDNSSASILMPFVKKDNESEENGKMLEIEVNNITYNKYYVVYVILRDEKFITSATLVKFDKGLTENLLDLINKQLQLDNNVSESIILNIIKLDS